MQAWFSYSLHDLLIFSEESYFRLYELANQALWPLQIPLVFSAILAMWLTRSKHEYARHIILLWLVIIWLFVGLWFVNGFYSQINTLAKPLSYLFLIESFLLALSAVLTRRDSRYAAANWLTFSGWFLLIYAYFVHPLSGLIGGRVFIGLEFVGVAPDPTALATIGYLMLLRPKAYWLLMLIPLIWIVLTILTYLAF